MSEVKMDDKSVSSADAPMTAEEEAAWSEKWDQPSPNPEFRGMTPKDVGRMLLRTRKPLSDNG